ncbi:hypothetical protein AB0M50_11730 [Nonomuraea fuscirosea]|uniref:hypothetical protein n=1 Tax=Nonomuraea fuscirosea TaxID=1291556 RepID=UPI00341F8CE8
MIVSSTTSSAIDDDSARRTGRADRDDRFGQPLADDVRGVISTTVHKFADAGKNLSTRSNIIVLVDETHRTQSDRKESRELPPKRGHRFQAASFRLSAVFS